MYACFLAAMYTWCLQFSAMFFKFWMVMWHRKVLTVCLLLFPAAMVAGLGGLNYAINAPTEPTNPITIKPITPCRRFNSHMFPVSLPCITVAYAPSAVAPIRFSQQHGITANTHSHGAAADDVAAFVAASSSLSMGKDVVGYATADDLAWYVPVHRPWLLRLHER